VGVGPSRQADPDLGTLRLFPFNARMEELNAVRAHGFLLLFAFFAFYSMRTWESRQGKSAGAAGERSKERAHLLG
jgi:hypothetical protein